uniref:non-specific serine/threonine protein kinase n=1 Tax=Anopheles merus TaxID=30066 RepID=A0A182UN70_ANOME
MGKRNAAAAIVDADRLQQFETPPKRMKHGPSNAAPPPATAAAAAAVAAPAREPYSPNISVSEFTLSKEFVDGTKLMDLTLKQWRIGKPIGKGSFGEIFLASDDIDTPVTSENAKYVVKIEPHSNGPLFVEIHCLLNTAKPTETCIIPPGMPEYIASGSHMFENERYRFLILKRYQRDLHSLIKNKRVNPTSIPVIACQILDVLEHLHDQGYVHSDIKAENLMIGTVETDRKDASVRLSNGSHHQNGHDHHRPNGVTLPPEGGRVGRGRSKKAAAEVPVAVNGAAHPQENGLYYHQEQEMCTRTRNLRPLKTVTYRDLSDEDERGGGARSKAAGSLPKRRGRKRNNDASFSCSISPRRSGYEELKAATEEAHRQELKRNSLPKVDEQQQQQQQGPEEERIHLIDFGLASKFVDSTGQHRPFCMDQRRAHDGTLEFTSRDAHMGAHARRSDLECLGYNLVYWSRGFLPWKDEKLLNQPEQVHRMKEYFMADVREMLRLIYGDDCPAYLGEFLAYVGNLTYDERPDYQYCKSLFYKELKRLGSPVSRHQPLRLDVGAIVQLSEPLTAQDEAEITNKINHVKSLMKMGALIPYRESMLHSKASSPKNLRSKRGDANGRNAQSVTVTDGAAATPATGGSQHVPSAVCTRKKEKPFSCADIFATDADQIARDRVEKEFERAEQMEETVIRYTGKPTYAIQELLERKSRGYSLGSGLEYTESEGYIKGYTKPMMDILRKRQSQLFRQIEEMNSAGKNKKETASDGDGNTAPMEQEGGDEEEDGEDDEEEEEEEQEEEQEEDEEVEAAPDNELENEEDEEEEVKLSKYEQDDDYEQAAEDEDEDDSVEDDDDEEEVASEEEEAEEESVEEDDEEEDDEEAVEEDEEEEAEGGAVVQNGYESRGSYRRKHESKGRKKEDTDSDFINDGGCEEEEEQEEEGAETDVCNLPDADEEAVDDAEEEEANDDDQQDSDFNDQESTATESDVIVPVKRRPGRKRKEPPQPQAAHDSRDERGGIVTGRRKVGRPRKHSSSKNTDIHDHREEEASDSSRAKVATGSSSKQRSDHRKKERKEWRRQQRREVLDDGDGDNARLFGDHQREDEVEAVDGREAVRKQTHHPYNNNNHCNSKAYYGDVDDSSHDMAPPTGTGEDRNASKYRFVKRRKSGLRERIRPTDRGTDYADNLQRKRKAALQNKQRRESAALLGELEDEDGADSEALLPSPSGVEDDSSCSSSSSSSSSTGTSHSVSSSCSVGNRSSRAISHSSSAASLASSSSIVPAQKRRGRKRKQPPPLVSSRDSSGTRQSSTAQCAISSTVRSRRQPTVTDSEATGGHSTNRWGRSNSNSSQSAATSRASSVSASANGASEYAAAQHHQQSHHHHQLATLPEQQDDFLDDDDGDDTRDVDYSPVCTRRRRKEAAGGNGAVSRKHGTTTTIRRKHDSKGLVGKGLGTAPSSPPSPTLPPPPPPPLAVSSSSSSSSAVNGGGTGVNLPPLYGQSSISRRLDNTIQPPPPPPVPPVAALIQHHHQQQQQQQQQHQRGRRPQHHHMAYQNYYRVNDQHHLPSTMLVRTYSRG